MVERCVEAQVRRNYYYKCLFFMFSNKEKRNMKFAIDGGLEGGICWVILMLLEN